MNSFSGLARRALTRVHGQLPDPLRTRVSGLIHGETPVQQDVSRRLRALSRRVHVEGRGDQVVGGALRPYRAVTASRFDAWQHLELMRSAVVKALGDAFIDVFELPNEPVPLLVVRSSDWAVVWRVLSSNPAINTFWVQGDATRPRPIGGSNGGPASRCVRVFQQLRASGGELLADERNHIRLEGWEEVTVKAFPRVDGGYHEVGTLLIGSEPNFFTSYLAPKVQERLRAQAALPIDWPPSVDAVNQPVDLVYTWVDGSDSAWLAKKESCSEGTGPTTFDAQISARFENRDELLYSLRSVEMYANWYNHVYLVTDEQVPTWLNTAHPRLTVVDHKDLFTDAELPVFNSHAIESRLHHIEGLSELFIYMNDDVFFGRPVRPELFFTGAGQPKFFPSKAHIDPDDREEKDVSVTAAVKNNRGLLERELGRTFFTKLKHTPHAHSTSLLHDLESRCPEVFRSNISARFRSHEDHSILSSLAQRYGAATGRALVGAISYNYTDIARPDVHATLNRWLSTRIYDAWCLNDTGLQASEGAQTGLQFKRFVTNYFPLPSAFENESQGHL